LDNQYLSKKYINLYNLYFIINVDVDGAYNIMKKAFPNAITADGIEAFGLMPQILQQNIVGNSICNKMSTVKLVLIV